MKLKRVLALSLLTAGIILMSDSIVTSETALPMKKFVTPSTQAPAMQKRRGQPQTTPQQPLQQIKPEISFGGSRIIPSSPQRQATVRDLRCSVTASYDQNGANAIQSTGPTSGICNVANTAFSPGGRKVWVHVRIDYTGLRGERGALSCILYTRSLLAGHVHEHTYNMVIAPGESQVWDFSFGDVYMFALNGCSLGFSAQVDKTDILHEMNENNNFCGYSIKFVQ